MVDEIALLLDEVQARRRLQDHERALRMLEGAHALDPERLDLRFLLLEVGTEAFRREMTRRGRRTNEERQAFYARTVPAAFRRIALAERIVANDLPHGLHAKYRIFGWGDPKRSYLVPGIFDLFSLPRLHDGPAGAGEDVQGDLIEALRRLHARYRAAVRGKNDHVMASILASATKSFPMLIAPGEDPVAYAVGVREEAAALMRRIALPEGPTGLSCGDRLLDADDETGAGMRQILLAHAEPLLRFTGLCALAKRAKEDAERADRARAALAFLRDPAIAKVPAPGSYPWYRRYVVDLVRLLPDEAERRGIVADLLGERPPDTPEPSSAPNSRYALVEVLPFDPAFDGRRLLGEEGVLALLGTRRDGGGHSLCLHRLDADGRKVITTQGFTLQGDAPRGKLAVAARADGTVLVGHADLGLVLFPAEGEAGVLRPSVAEGSAPIRAVAAAGGKVYVLVGGPHDASGLVEIDPADGRERLLLSSRSREPRSPLDGRPLRALCSYPGGAGLLVEAGPRLVPRPADPGDLRDGSTFYGFEPEVDRVVPVLGRRDLGLLGEGTFIALRRAGTRALVEALPVVLDLDLESGAYDVLYAVPTTRRVARLPTRWRGPDWPSPISRVGSDLMCRQGRRLVLFVDGEPKSVPFWSRVKLPERSAEPPAVRDALPRPDGALLLAPSRLYRLERVEVR